MKKLLVVLFSLLFTAIMLVGCGDIERGEWLGDGKDDDGKVVGGNYDGYETVNTIPEVDINLYIIVEDETLADGAIIPSNTQGKYGAITQAINTVNNRIKDYTSTKYHTAVNVIYYTESQYNEAVLKAAAADSTAPDAANIVLVNSYALMQDLYAIKDKSGNSILCPLDAYLDTTKYGRLNTAIPTSLFEASMMENSDGTKSLYTIPNNHVIGNYEYLLVNKELVKELKISETAALGLNSYEAAAKLIGDAIVAESKTFAVDDVITLVLGAYEDRVAYEANGYYCNVVKAPIADKNEAFLSSFAIINRNTEGSKVDVNARAMEIVYNINMDTELRNLLQYGVSGTNYFMSDGVVTELDDASNRYSMNLLYTGNILNAYLCEDIGWTAQTKENAILQNADSMTVEQAKALENEK